MKKRILVPLVAVLSGAAWFMLPLPRVAAADEVDFIVNKANTITEMPVVELKKIYMGDRNNWPSGRRITVLMLAAGPERTVVLREIYKMSEGDYSKYFLQAAFTGKITAPPKNVASAALVKQMVAENPGAVGYVKKGDADDSVKVVFRIE